MPWYIVIRGEIDKFSCPDKYLKQIVHGKILGHKNYSCCTPAPFLCRIRFGCHETCSVQKTRFHSELLKIPLETPRLRFILATWYIPQIAKLAHQPCYLAKFSRPAVKRCKGCTKRGRPQNIIFLERKCCHLSSVDAESTLLSKSRLGLRILRIT